MTVRTEIRLAQPADRAAVLGLVEDFCGVEGKRFDVAVARAGLDPLLESCLLYTSPSPRDRTRSRMPSSA